MYFFNFETTTKISPSVTAAEESDAMAGFDCAGMILFTGAVDSDDVGAGVDGAKLSIAAASLWRAPGKCRSKQGTEQNTNPVLTPLQVETLH
jgi:hypothetical protein